MGEERVSVKIKTTLDFHLLKIFLRPVQAMTAFIFWAKSIPQPWFSNLDEVCVLAAGLDFPSMETSIWLGCVRPTRSLGQIEELSVCTERCSQLTYPINSLNSLDCPRASEFRGFKAPRIPVPCSPVNQRGDWENPESKLPSRKNRQSAVRLEMF